MKYVVTMAVDGRYTCEVEAASIEEAKEQASKAFFDADFGDLEDIDAECVNVENEEGDF